MVTVEFGKYIIGNLCALLIVNWLLTCAGIIGSAGIGIAIGSVFFCGIATYCFS